MKHKLLALFLAAALLFALSGCNLDAAEDRIEQTMDMAEDRLEASVASAAPQTALTEDEAVAIALEHAGLTQDQISHLQVRYEVDDRIPEYEIDFRQGRVEYDYTIHAETGEVLSFETGD